MPTLTEVRPEDQSASISLITHNIYGVPFAPDMKKRANAFVKKINDDSDGDRFDADFVAIQEGFTHTTRSRLRKSEEHPYFALPHKTRCHKIMNGGVGALSQYPIILKKYLPLKLKNTDSWVDKGVLLTRVDHPVLGELDFYTLHLQASYKTPAQYQEVRDIQVQDLLRFIKEQSGDRTIVLSGDFNMGESEPAYTMMMNSNLGFIDVMRELHPQDSLATWRMENPYTADDWPTQRLDYVFLRPGEGWQWDKEESRGETLTACDGESESADTCWVDNAVSDHYGIFAKMKLRRNVQTNL